MSVTVSELAATGPFGTDSVERKYSITFSSSETPTDALALAVLQAAVGTSDWEGVPLNSTSVTPTGNQYVWEGTASYKTSDASGGGGSVVGEDLDVVKGSTRGGRQTITQSLATSKFPANAPDEGGAIGFDGEKVCGVEIDVPTGEWSKTKRVLAANHATFFSTCMNATGTVNATAFQGFDAGEVKFLGADFDGKDGEDFIYTLHYAFSKNVTGLTVGTIGGIAKGGWEILDVRYADAVDTTTKSILKKPLYVYTHKVYKSGTLPS